jgi:hypothetical protein
METSTVGIAELSALGAIIVVFLLAAWRGVPALFAYLKCKDTKQRDDLMSLIAKHREDIMSLVAKHREDTMTLIAASRAERDAFYEHSGIQFDKVHERLDRIESSIIKPT